MANPPNRQNQGSNNLPINEKVLAQMLEVQLLKAKNESRELEIRSKEIDHQAQYANNSLKHQAEFLKNRPNENRKTMTRFAYIVFAFVVLFVIMVSICLYLNKEAFLITLLKGFGYVITTLGGYWAGKKSKHGKNSESETQDNS